MLFTDAAPAVWAADTGSGMLRNSESSWFIPDCVTLAALVYADAVALLASCKACDCASLPVVDVAVDVAGWDNGCVPP